MNTHLQEVRAQIIAAVPEIGEREHETDMPHCWCEPEKEVVPGGNMVIVHRKTRPEVLLADVLMAIGQRFGENRLMVGSLGGFRHYHTGDVLPGWEDIAFPRWNLALPLDDQEPEVIEFLHKILINQEPV